MKITVNGRAVEVYPYDNDDTIIERYSLLVPRSLPSFFRMADRNPPLTPGVSIEIEDVRKVISEIDERNLDNLPLIEGILIAYPLLRPRDLAILWIRGSGKELSQIRLEPLKRLDRYAFTSISRTQTSIEEFETEVEKKRERLQGRVQEKKELFLELERYSSVEMGAFQIEQVSEQMIIRLPQRESLPEVFDALGVSREIPFILLISEKKRFFKVYRHLIPPEAWLQELPEEEGIYFKILNFPAKRLTSETRTEELYSNAVWTPENRVILNFKIKQGIEEENIRQYITAAIEDRMVYEVSASRQSGIKGTFMVPNFRFNRAIFSDLVGMDPLFRRILFFNEREGSILKRKNYYLYFEIGQTGIVEGSLALLFTPSVEKGVHSLEVRILHSRNLQEANSTRLVLGKLFHLYQEKYEEVVETYSATISNFKTLADLYVKKEKEKVDKKTGVRAKLLRQFDEKMFPHRYPDQCQRHAHPYVITDEKEAKRLQTELGDPHKVMEFRGAWYACEPREPDDKNNKHLWPGLKPNASKTDREYREKYPLLPCCYVRDQYTKKASHLRRYLDEKQGEARVEKDTSKYVITSNKKIPADRYGTLPFNWRRFLQILGIKEITRTKQTFYPILRHSVIESPDSFLHCLTDALYADYRSFKTPAEKQELIAKIREEMAQLPLAPGMQELYDYTADDIQKILRDPSYYIDPDRFVSLAEYYFNCNIFLFVVDKEHPDSDVCIPRYSQAYLPKHYDTEKKTIIIIKYQSDLHDYPYQCEYLCRMKVKDNGETVYQHSFRDSLIVPNLISLFDHCNTVFIVTPEGQEEYRPVPLEEGQ